MTYSNTHYSCDKYDLWLTMWKLHNLFFQTKIFLTISVMFFCCFNFCLFSGVFLDHHAIYMFLNIYITSRGTKIHMFWIYMNYRWSCLPVFGPNIREVSITTFWAAIGRAAVLFIEAACPAIAGISASHSPSGSHCPLKQFTKNLKSK